VTGVQTCALPILGIAFLLFTAGLEISFRKIKEANLKKIALVGFLQVGIIFLAVLFLNSFSTKVFIK